MCYYQLRYLRVGLCSHGIRAPGVLFLHLFRRQTTNSPYKSEFSGGCMNQILPISQNITFTQYSSSVNVAICILWTSSLKCSSHNCSRAITRNKLMAMVVYVLDLISENHPILPTVCCRFSKVVIQLKYSLPRCGYSMTIKILDHRSHWSLSIQYTSVVASQAKNTQVGLPTGD